MNGELSTAVQLAITVLILSIVIAASVTVYGIGKQIERSMSDSTDEIITSATNSGNDLDDLVTTTGEIPLTIVYRIIEANKDSVLRVTGIFSTGTITTMTVQNYISNFHTKVTISATKDSNMQYTITVREVN